MLRIERELVNLDFAHEWTMRLWVSRYFWRQVEYLLSTRALFMDFEDLVTVLEFHDMRLFYFDIEE